MGVIFIVAALFVSLAVREKRERTVLSWTRSTEGCGDDVDIVTGVTRLIWAIGDDLPSDPNVVQRHTLRGGESVVMAGKSTAPPEIGESEESVDHYDLQIKEFEVPARALDDPDGPNRTSYVCGVLELPKSLMDGKKRHMIRTEALITPGNEERVHHMLFYACNAQLEEVLDQYPSYADSIGEVHACYIGDHEHPVMPELVKKYCKQIFTAWAIGGSDTYMPAEAGLPLGTEYFSKIFVEYHYDNESKQKFTDNSGLRLHFTEDLREHDAGVLQVGTVDEIVIPPREENFSFLARCAGGSSWGEKDGCLGDFFLGEDGITITHSSMHGHLASKQIFARVLDEAGNVKGNVGDEKYYDFNLQSYFKLNEPVKVLPGDSIDVECVYDTSDRSTTTYGGSGTLDEMCLGFFVYYPRIRITECKFKHVLDSSSDEEEPTQDPTEYCRDTYLPSDECPAFSACLADLACAGEISQSSDQRDLDCIHGDCEGYSEGVQAVYACAKTCLAERAAAEQEAAMDKYCRETYLAAECPAYTTCIGKTECVTQLVTGGDEMNEACGAGDCSGYEPEIKEIFECYAVCANEWAAENARRRLDVNTLMLEPESSPRRRRMYAEVGNSGPDYSEGVVKSTCKTHDNEQQKIIKTENYDMTQKAEEVGECVPVESEDATPTKMTDILNTDELASYFAANYENHWTLSSDPEYHVYWTHRPLEKEIDIAVDVQTTGWVGLGISPNGNMKGADMMMGWVDDEGEVHITDRFAHDKVMPTIDDVQSYKNMKGMRITADMIVAKKQISGAVRTQSHSFGLWAVVAVLGCLFW